MMVSKSTDPYGRTDPLQHQRQLIKLMAHGKSSMETRIHFREIIGMAIEDKKGGPSAKTLRKRMLEDADEVEVMSSA